MVDIIEYLLCATHFSRYLTCTDLQGPQKNPMRKMLSFCTFYGEETETQRLSTLPKVTATNCSRTRI